MRPFALALVVALVGAARADAGSPHVYLVVVDGLGVEALDPTLMPRLAAMAPGRTEAQAAMPTRTNPNHATLLTGVLPESHGITGNGWWDRAARAPKSLDDAELLEAETLFTIAETTRPALVTVAAFSKAKLGRLFAAVPDRQRAPDVLWVPSTDGVAGHLIGVASDADTMDAFLAATASLEPDLAAVNLSEVDRTAHEQGPGRTAEARRHADAAVGRLVDDLRARGRWERSIVVVTADHGFDDVSPTSDRPVPVVSLADRFADAGLASVHVVSDGGVEHVYADEPDATTLGWAAAIAWHEVGVAEVLTRSAVAGVPGLAATHRDWGLDHERTGDLLLVAAPGFQFVDAPDEVARAFRGNHGSPREMRVPLVIAGGALVGPPQLSSIPTAADVGATLGALVGLRPARRLDGHPTRPGHPFALELRPSL